MSDQDAIELLKEWKDWVEGEEPQNGCLLSEKGRDRCWGLLEQTEEVINRENPSPDQKILSRNEILQKMSSIKEMLTAIESDLLKNCF